VQDRYIEIVLTLFYVVYSMLVPFVCVVHRFIFQG